MLSSMRQNTISKVDIVSDRNRTDTWVVENSTIDKTAMVTAFRTVGDFRVDRDFARSDFMALT